MGELHMKLPNSAGEMGGSELCKEGTTRRTQVMRPNEREEMCEAWTYILVRVQEANGLKDYLAKKQRRAAEKGDEEEVAAMKDYKKESPKLQIQARQQSATVGGRGFTTAIDVVNALENERKSAAKAERKSAAKADKKTTRRQADFEAAVRAEIAKGADESKFLAPKHKKYEDVCLHCRANGKLKFLQEKDVLKHMGEEHKVDLCEANDGCEDKTDVYRGYVLPQLVADDDEEYATASDPAVDDLLAGAMKDVKVTDSAQSTEAGS